MSHRDGSTAECLQCSKMSAFRAYQGLLLGHSGDFQLSQDVCSDGSTEAACMLQAMFALASKFFFSSYTPKLAHPGDPHVRSTFKTTSRLVAKISVKDPVARAPSGASDPPAYSQLSPKKSLL